MNSTYQNLKMPSNQKFGYLFAVIFTVISIYLWAVHSRLLAILFIKLAILFVIVASCIPSLLSPLNKAWFNASLLLGKIFSPVVLSIFFLIFITPIALITRLFGRDILLLKKRRVASYWVDKEPIEPDSFKNQF